MLSNGLDRGPIGASAELLFCDDRPSACLPACACHSADRFARFLPSQTPVSSTTTTTTSSSSSFTTNTYLSQSLIHSFIDWPAFFLLVC
ncbi:unnamed protein product [Periconia digitata]|uniref:Uncharacterized protein n=1 Tax=Periconia digitata TaxID=1303443 RepID=A0A9W4UJC0_9PLEO|nr:unnamed protein product [Periconia digitata]